LFPAAGKGGGHVEVTRATAVIDAVGVSVRSGAVGVSVRSGLPRLDYARLVSSL